MNKGRFKSQALLDEQAILSCMVYVDLNPIRADMCMTLEESDYTSVKQRIEQVTVKPNTTYSIKLTPFISSSLKENGISFSLKDYLELADWTGRSVRNDKRGYIESGTPKILQKLDLDEQTWVETVQGFSTGFHTYIGPEDKLQSLCQKQMKHWVRGINVCRKLFRTKQLLPVPT